MLLAMRPDTVMAATNYAQVAVRLSPSRVDAAGIGDEFFIGGYALYKSMRKSGRYW